MDQRISPVTVGVRDLGRARDFSAALGWRGESPDGDVVFLQAARIVVVRWDRAKLAAESGVPDSGGGAASRWRTTLPGPRRWTR